MNESSPFWVNNVYSLGYWLKDYGYYPKNWPLCNYIDHGVTLFDTIPPHETENDAPLIFKFSPRLVKEYKKVSKKPVYGLKNPTIHCRDVKNIEQTQNAHGTLYFPGHSTETIDDLTDWNVFIDSLENIPSNFKPIDVSLHPSDIKKGLDKIFIAKGYKVYTAGDAFLYDFAENMYNILKNYKYTMSNLLGSYVFYSVEMGIPFSLYGQEPQYINNGDPNVEKGAFTSYRKQPTYEKAVELFSGLCNSISNEQKEFVEYELGKKTSISRKKTFFLLYRAYFMYSFKHPRNFKYILNLIRGKI